MTKTILITGSTDGIGLDTARSLVSLGHHVILHGRSGEKLAAVESELLNTTLDAKLSRYIADLSELSQIRELSSRLLQEHDAIDVLINNAGVFKAEQTTTADGLDVRFVVNTIAPYVLARELTPFLSSGGRIVNLSSAAQAPVDLDALAGKHSLDTQNAYAQSKLALTMWSIHLGLGTVDTGRVVVAVNPGSMLATKMVREGFGVAGHDRAIGASILTRAALDDDFSTASGRYFDNDTGHFGDPHRDALNPEKRAAVIETIDQILAR